MRPNPRWIILIGGFLSVVTAALMAQAKESSLTSGLLVEEVLVSIDEPHEFDWRKTPWQIELGYFGHHENNSFDSNAWSLGVAKTVARGWLARVNLRYVSVSDTPSSRLLGLTPFSQAAQPARYEALAGAGYALLEGRSRTPLNPWLTDIGHALYVLGGLQYNFFGAAVDQPLSGMQTVRYTIVGETGLRFQIFLPRSLGVSFEWTYSIPLSARNPDLPSWQRFGGNVSWSFGQ